MDDETTKVHWTLKNQAIALIDESTTPGKRGELVSEIILSYGRIMGAATVPNLDCGVSERIEQRLQLIEQRLQTLLMLAMGDTLPAVKVVDLGAGNE